MCILIVKIYIYPLIFLSILVKILILMVFVRPLAGLM